MNRLNKLYLTLIGVIAILIVVAPTQAQDEDNVWYWAWRSYDLAVEEPEDQQGDLLAFKPDGTINVLLEYVFPVVLERVDESTAFVSGKIDDTYRLYYLTSTQAVEVIELFEQTYIDDLYQNAIYEGYAYFTPEIIPAGETSFLLADKKRNRYFIYDTIENTTLPLDLRPWCNDDCVRVSADGRFIRYRVSQTNPMRSLVSYDPGENTLPYQLYEYDTVTQTERIIHEQVAITFVEGEEAPPRGDCTPDTTGSFWYCELFVNGGNVADEKYVVDAVGNIESINPNWQLRVLDGHWYFLDLDRNRADCDPCVINVFPDGYIAASFQFVVPPVEEFPIWYGEVQMLSEQQLLPNPTGQPMYALSRSGELTELGMRPCCADPISMDYYDEKNGWMILWYVSNSNEQLPNETVIWQTQPFNQFATFPGLIETGTGGATFRDYSFVFSDVVYSYFDAVLYDLDFVEPMQPIDAFPGGALLYDRGDADPFTMAVENDAIYRWTPQENLMLIVDGASPIQRRF